VYIYVCVFILHHRASLAVLSLRSALFAKVLSTPAHWSVSPGVAVYIPNLYDDIVAVFVRVASRI